MKGNIFCSKGPAMARICGANETGTGTRTGFLIHRNLLLTTHVNLPSVTEAEGAEIRLQDGVPARLVPHRFFITSSVLDLTIVGLDVVDGDSSTQVQQPHYLKTCSNPSLDLGSAIYVLGYSEKKELMVGEGKVVIATDNLIKLSTGGETWSPGSAGFDVQGNLAFMVCDPMKLATSPAAKSSSTSSSSSSSWKKDLAMQFGIPIPIICDWLNQHWEGSLDELNKPKLPLIRLMSTGQKSEHSCASFTLRRVFKPAAGENDDTPSSSHIISKLRDEPGPSCSATKNLCEEETHFTVQNATIREQGIPTPEIYESPRLTSVPMQKKETTQIQLLDINFPPRVPRSMVLPQPVKQQVPTSHENSNEEIAVQSPPRVEDISMDRGSCGSGAEADIASTGSVNGGHSEVQSSSSPIGFSALQDGALGFHANYSSDGETMYSAETAESRNYPSPRGEKFQQVGRSQSCVSYNRWGAAHRNPIAHKASQSFMQGRKMYSQGATSQRSHEYYSPTVSSIMKKRNNSEQLNRPRLSAVHSSPRWMF